MLRTEYLMFEMMAILLAIGIFLHEKVAKKYFIPASLLGGTVGLLLGQQCLNVITIPTEFAKIPGLAIKLVLACIVLNVSLGANVKTKLKSYLEHVSIFASMYGLQLFVGVLFATLLERFMTIPFGFGTFGVFCFWGGHGAASIAATTYNDFGVDLMGVAMALATVGLVLSLTLGTVIVNWGIKKGYASFVTKANQLGITDDENKPYGYVKISEFNINALLMQVMLVFLAYALGDIVFSTLKTFTNFSINNTIYGMFGAVLLRAILTKLNLEYYIDHKSISTISGFLLDVLIVCAVSTLKIKTVIDLLIPMVLLTIVMMLVTVPLLYIETKYFFQKEWLEKFVCLYGACIGMTATGLTLTRMLDPESKSETYEYQGVSDALWSPVYSLAPFVVPAILYTSPNIVVAFGVVCFLLPCVMFVNRKINA